MVFFSSSVHYYVPIGISYVVYDPDTLSLCYLRISSSETERVQSSKSLSDDSFHIARKRRTKILPNDV